MSGPWALVGIVLALAIPTVVRFAVHGSVTGCEFTPYLPFVLLSAIMLGWVQAGIVAFGSVAILGGWLVAPLDGHVEMPCFVSGAGIFLASSAMLIAIVWFVRRILSAALGRDPDEPTKGVVFSVERGDVWASWRGSGPPLRLGSKASVSAVMEDFLAQNEHAKRGEDDAT